MDGAIKSFNAILAADIEIVVTGNPRQEFVMNARVSWKNVTAKPHIF